MILGGVRRTHWIVIPVAILALLAGCGLAAKSAPAKVPAKFWGVVITSPPTQADFNTMKRGKVGTARIQINWAGVQGAKGPCTALTTSNCNWSGVDATVGGLAKKHISILATLYGTPEWASGRSGMYGGRYDPLHTKRGRKGWSKFIIAVAQRYGPGGAYWHENPSLPKQPIRIWQVWNEQNSSNAYRPGPDPKGYAKLLEFTSKKLRKEDHGAEIMLGGMFGTPGQAGAAAMTAWKYLDRLYAIKGARGAFDSIALHPYSPDIAGIKYQIGKIRDVLKKHHASSTRLWLTELGWGSDAKHVNNRLVKTKAQQKNLLVQSFNLLRSHRQSWKIAGVTWFAFRDPTDPNGQCLFCLSSGLLTKTLKPKPSWHAFVGYTGGKP